MSYLRRALVVLFTALVVAGLAPATSAQAAWGCSGYTSWLFNQHSATCQGGSFAVAGRCSNWLGYQVYVQGPRRWGYATSTVYCPSGYRPYGSGWILHYS
jgi:hypothetical protein